MKLLSLFCFGTMVALTSAAALDVAGSPKLEARGCKKFKEHCSVDGDCCDSRICKNAHDPLNGGPRWMCLNS